MPSSAFVRRALVAIVAGLASTASPIRAMPCAGTAALTVVVDNQSADAALTLEVAGELVDPATTCAGDGQTSYQASLSCMGAGVVRCGRIAGLRPGAWVHRIALQVGGSARQVQAQRAVVLAGADGVVSNMVRWEAFPRTFVVAAATETALRAALAQASAFTAGDVTRRALVTFDPTVFPGAGSPTTVEVGYVPPTACTDEVCAEDGRSAGLCLDGERIVVDALDADARRGGVVLSAGTCNRSLLRVYGSGNVLRGLTLVGGVKPAADQISVDTVVMTLGATGTRLEQCEVRGPSRGDGISVERDAAATVVDSEIWGAENKGVKATLGGQVTVARSCVHDNQNGGIQSTLGGVVVASENVVQHNVPGSAQNGLSAHGTADARSFLTTDGNIVRFAGARGLTVVDNAEGHFHNDYVADNQFAGGRVETTSAMAMSPVATFRGVAFVCNGVAGVTGTCRPLDGGGPGGPTPACQFDLDPRLPQCPATEECVVASPSPDGVGFVAARCADCPSPELDLGQSSDQGRNAFVLNARTPDGANVTTGLPEAFPARANQWEHCGAEPRCDEAAVLASDVRPASTPAAPAVDVGSPTSHRRLRPTVTHVSPRRPRAGDLVRVYGTNFNAIDGAACAGAALPVSACSAENAALAAASREDPLHGNFVKLAIGGAEVPAADLPIWALTPAMLAFEMPVDCHGVGTLQVGKGNDPADVSAPIGFCDPLGCTGEPPTTPCDDGSRCTVDDHCAGDGTDGCVGGSEIACVGQCLTGTCDPATGCVSRAATTSCDDGNACTVGDRCSGVDATCIAGVPADCAGPCLTGACDPALGCVPVPAGALCDDGDPCTTGEQCAGAPGSCTGGVAVACDDRNPCTDDACTAGVGCGHTPVADRTPCRDALGCFPPSVCRAGACELIEPPACSDGDPCTVDTCEGLAGCTATAVLGFPGVACRLDQLEGMLEGLPRSNARRIGTRVRRVRVLVERAERVAAADKPGRARRVLARADRRLLGLSRAVDRKLGIGLPLDLARQVRSVTDAARSLTTDIRNAIGGP